MAKDTSTFDGGHPIVCAVAEVRASVGAAIEASTWSMSDDEVQESALALARLEAQVAELGRRVLGEVDRRDLAENLGASTTANWLAHATKLTRTEAHARVRQAKALDRREQTRVALAAGGLHLEQASAITHAVDKLPEEECPAETQALVEKTLISYASEFDAKTLRILGRRVWEVIDPEAAEAHEAELLAKEEDAAAAATKLSMHNDGSGAVRGRFTIPALQAAMFKKLLLAFAAPKHQQSTEDPTPAEAPSAKKLGEAFCEMIESYPTDTAPRAGGVSATAVIHLDHDTLMGGLKAAHLDTGEPVSPGQARRMACEAGLVPVVLNGQSQVLDLGRLKRLFSRSQRIAAGIAHPTCQAATCDWPSGMCHLHHLDPWHHGGRTDLRRAAVLCPRHHALIHHPGYDHEHRADGSITFHRRT